MDTAFFLRAAARFSPDRVGLTEGARSATYAELDQTARRVAANLLSTGIAPGDRVALSAPNVIEFVEAYFAILYAGAVVVPFNLLLTSREISHVLSDSGARAIICHEGSEATPLAARVVDAMADVASCPIGWVMGARNGPLSTYSELKEPLDVALPSSPIAESDVAAILYTSGTTGTPKGACLSHANLVSSGLVNAEAMNFKEGDNLLLPLPLFHVFGQVVFLLAGLFARARIDLVPRFEPSTVLEAMEKKGTTIFGGVPTMYSALLKASDELSDRRLSEIGANLRHCISGASALPVDLLQGFERRFGTVILEGYGLTEASPTVAFARRDMLRKPGTVGYPMWGVDVRIVDTDGADVPTGARGELICRGPGIFVGYHNRPPATAETLRDGWLHTGDVAIRDEDGVLSIVDRVKDIVIRGGYNIYPREVEEVLAEHPDVLQAAVTGRPDSHFGEEVCAFVTLKDGAKTTPEDLIDHARSRLAAYKYPREIHIEDSLPMGGTGKVLKTVLRERLAS